MDPQTHTNAYIEPVDIDELGRTASRNDDESPQPSPFPTALEQAEMDYIRAWRKARGDPPEPGQERPAGLFGLALSGGGIRSATFSLGVLQALSSRGLLERVDYLSTVSGGGYIGSALTWLLSKKAEDAYRERTLQEPLTHPIPEGPLFTLRPEQFPFGTDDPAPEGARQDSSPQRHMLRYLREHGYYLTPGAGITGLSLLGIVLRGTFLNLMVWVPVSVLYFVFGMWLFGHVSEESAQLPMLSQLMAKEIHESTLIGFELFLWIGLLLLAVTLLLTLLYSVLTYFRSTRSTHWIIRTLARLAGKRDVHSESGVANAWYDARRIAEHWGAVALTVFVLFLLVGALPAIAYHLAAVQQAVGPLTMLSGIGMAMRDFLTPKPATTSTDSSFFASFAAALFLFGGFLMTYELAAGLFAMESSLVMSVSLLLTAMVLLFGWFVNLNYISIHSYYRDRLMETFMPDIQSALSNTTGAAYGADLARLSELCDPAAPRGPYHIVNTNVILVDSKRRLYQNRGGDSFILSSLYCGSGATGWCRTQDFNGGHLTLATAVAISGAAANPNTGVGGVGLTRNRLLSFVMALLNLRLGYWASHMAPNRNPGHMANHFRPGAYAFANLIGFDRFGFHEHRPFLQLSDGGHFENTGIYELVRRKPRLIICCDGGADKEFSFSDFQTTIHRMEQDFGARVRFSRTASPDGIVPAPCAKPHFPKDAPLAKRGHMVGCITYADGSQGWLLYLKTTLTGAVSFKVKGYAAQYREFPDQSTRDQFFDEVQFEAYRELGYRLASDMLASRFDLCDGCDGAPEQTESRSIEEIIRACSAKGSTPPNQRV